MHLKGQPIEPPKPELIVIPRASGDIILYASPIMSFEEFKAGVPQPKPPTITKRGEQPQDDFDDTDYKKAMKDFADVKFSWTLFKSLTLGTPDLVFDTIKSDDANTWNNFESEMLKTFTQGELNQIVTKVMEANGLNQSRMQEARDRFLNPDQAVTAKP